MSSRDIQDNNIYFYVVYIIFLFFSKKKKSTFSKEKRSSSIKNLLGMTETPPSPSPRYFTLPPVSAPDL